MTLRQLYEATRPLIVPADDDAEVMRVAERIYVRCLDEGEPIGMQEAFERATIALYEVHLMTHENSSAAPGHPA